MKNLKIFGILICVIGNLLAILYVPVKSWGNFIGYYFINTNMLFGIRAWQMMDLTVLLLELILINGLGIALIFLGLRSEKSN